MGLYDNIKFKNPEDKDVILQTKVLDRSLQTYKIGDIINSTDGIFFCHEGAYVVFNGCKGSVDGSRNEGVIPFLLCCPIVCTKYSFSDGSPQSNFLRKSLISC